MSKTTSAYLNLSDIYGSFGSTFDSLPAAAQAFAQAALEKDYDVCL